MITRLFKSLGWRVAPVPEAPRVSDFDREWNLSRAKSQFEKLESGCHPEHVTLLPSFRKKQMDRYLAQAGLTYAALDPERRYEGEIAAEVERRVAQGHMAVAESCVKLIRRGRRPNDFLQYAREHLSKSGRDPKIHRFGDQTLEEIGVGIANGLYRRTETDLHQLAQQTVVPLDAFRRPNPMKPFHEV